jgi:hypothetical protein
MQVEAFMGRERERAKLGHEQERKKERYINVFLDQNDIAMRCVTQSSKIQKK